MNLKFRIFSNKDFIWAGILALVLSFILFGNGISGDFVFDDTIVIVGNPLINENLDGFWTIFTTPYFAYQPRPGLYRPLTIASYSINTFVFGYSPVSFHIVNILLHALTSFLIFVLFYRLSGRAVALAGFAFFMFLPIHVEAITSIVGRAEILSLFFVVGALIFALKQKYILAVGSFFLGLLSKEIAIVFIPIFLFLTFSRSKASGSRREGLKGFYYLVSALTVYFILRYIALGEYFLKNDATVVYNPIKFAPFLSGIWTSFKVFYLYLEKTFFPFSLSSDYSFSQISLVENPIVSLEAMLGIIIFGLFIFLFFKTKDFLLRFGIVTFMASYFVISNWGFKTGTIMAERLMYAPSLGIAMIIGTAVEGLRLKISARSRSALGGESQNFRLQSFNLPLPLFTFYILLLILFTWYGWIIIDRNKDWLNSKNLYESAYIAAPNSVVNQTNKAFLEFMTGNYNEVEKRLDEVIGLAPEHVPALNLAGQNYKKLGQYQKAEESWKKAIALRNDFLRAYLSLGILYYENGYFKSAEKVLTEAIDVYPRWSEVLYLALVKVSLDKSEEAIGVIETYFGDSPPQKQLKFALGWAYLNMGDKDRAYRYFEEIRDPNIDSEDFVKTFEGSKIILLGVDN